MFENPARLFDPSENPSVFVQTDTCLTCVRFGMCVSPSVIPSVIVAQSRKFFATLCEIPTNRKVWRDFRTFLVRISINFWRYYRRKLMPPTTINFRRKNCNIKPPLPLFGSFFLWLCFFFIFSSPFIWLHLAFLRDLPLFGAW